MDEAVLQRELPCEGQHLLVPDSCCQWIVGCLIEGYWLLLPVDLRYRDATIIGIVDLLQLIAEVAFTITHGNRLFFIDTEHLCNVVVVEVVLRIG